MKFRVSDRHPSVWSLPHEFRVAAITENNPKNEPTAELTPMLDERWALKPRHLLVCLFFCGAFVLISSLPIVDWTVWRNVSVGRWILAHGSLPLDDPTQPLIQDAHLFHTNWLSQVALALADRQGGPQGVANLLTVVGLAGLAVLARIVYRQTGRIDLMLAGVVLAVVLGAGTGLFVGADAFGKLCFVLLLWLLVMVPKFWHTHPHVQKTKTTVNFLRHTVPFLSSCVQDPARTVPGGARWGVLAAAAWFGTAVLFALWANLHGSYVIGVAILFCCAAARGSEVVWQARNLWSALNDGLFRAYVVLAVTALVASLLNPHGPRLIPEGLAAFWSEPGAAESVWRLIDPNGLRGIAFFASVGLLGVLLLADWQQVSVTDVLLPLGFGIAVLIQPEVQSWYALVYVFVAMPHLAYIVGHGRWWGVTSVGKLVLPPQQRRRRTISIRRSMAEMGLPPSAGDGADPASPQGTRLLTPHSFLCTLLCGLAVYCAFCFAPGTQTLFGGKARPLGQLVGSYDVAYAAEWLREHDPDACIYALPRWSDLLVGLGGNAVTAMMTSNGRWAPQQVWTDFGCVTLAADGWEKVVDRYGIDTLVLSPREHAALVQAARFSSKWTPVYENEHLFLARRMAQ